MNNRFVVIGSNSFSGASFVSYLLKHGMSVIGIGRSVEPNQVFLPYKWIDHKNFKFYQMDLNHNLSDIMGVTKNFEPDYVVNFAAQSMVAESWKSPEDWFQTNVVANVKLHDALRGCKFLKKYVHVSTPEVYGTCVGNIFETAPLNPSTPYAASKAAGDLSLFTFAKNFSFPLVMVRATNVYGAYQQLFKIIPRSAIYLKMGKSIELHGGGVAIKSYIHIRDISRGELAIMEHGRIGEIYHLSPDQGVAVKDVVHAICKKMKVDFGIATKIVAERLGQDKAYTIDSTKARTELNWKPLITLDEGISQTVDWVEKSFDEIAKQPLVYIHKE